MKKVLSSMQMFETNENCNKFSKSVSCETLVGGTAKIGTGIKQTQRLSEGSADKPLTAVGTLTSLLCNSAKVKEKWLQISPVLRLVKVLGLVAVLSFTIITESFAECVATENNWIDTCHEWNPGVPNNCGEGCTYTYDSVNHKLTVTATKPDAVVSNGMFSASFYESGNRPYISDVEIDGEFKTIGTKAFNISANIHGKDWVLIVNETGNNSFDGSKVTGTVIVNDGLTRLGDGPWSNIWTGFNGTLILPPSITSIDGWFLRNLTLGADAKVYCGAEKCEELFSNVDCEGFFANETLRTQCKNHLSDLLDGKLLAYPDGCAKMWSTGCTKCKNENFKLNDGECDRLRWTPAEAAKVLRNDNTNSVTITFKM